MTGRRTVLIGGLALPLAAASLGRAMADPAATWDQIASTGKVRVGLIPNRPPYQWIVDGQVKGFIDLMARSFVAELGKAMGRSLEISYVPTTNQTIILDLQSNRMDVFIPLTFSPEREAAIDMFGPLYLMPVVAFNRKGFAPGQTWEAYNTPTTRVAVVMGTTDEQAARRRLPKATIRAMKSTSEAVLEVQSGAADAVVIGLLLGLKGMSANSNLGPITVLEPVDAPPSGGGTRKDGDGRFARFMRTWSTDFHQAGGAATAIRTAMKAAELDVDRIPAGVTF